MIQEREWQSLIRRSTFLSVHVARLDHDHDSEVRFPVYRSSRVLHRR